MPFDLKKSLPKTGNRFALPSLYGSADAYALAVAALELKASKQMLVVIVAGASDGQVRTFLTARYGQFVMLRPAFSVRNGLLWLGPFLLVLVGVGGWFGLTRRREVPEAAIAQFDFTAARTVSPASVRGANTPLAGISRYSVAPVRRSSAVAWWSIDSPTGTFSVVQSR